MSTRELRKRPAPPPAPEKPAKKKAAPKSHAKTDTRAEATSAKAPTAAGTATEAVKETASSAAAAAQSAAEAVAETVTKATKGGVPKAGETVDLTDFGGEIETNDGEKVTLAKLLGDSKAGVVLFTYPKASTPGCTTQACLFRDSYEPLTATGLSIYGLSTDSPKSNTTFKTKQNLPYPLLCDPKATLIGAIGMKKAPKGTTRGVFVVDKSGKVLAAEAGGPAPTVEVVKKVVAEMGGDSSAKGLENAEERAAADMGDEEGDTEMANTAAEVADTAAGMDGTPQPT